MSRAARWLGAMLVGMVGGVVGIFWLQSAPNPVTTPTSIPTLSTETTSAAISQPTTSSLPTPSLFLIWTSGGLPEGLGDQVGAVPGVDVVSTVRSDIILIQSTYDSAGSVVEDLPEGWYYPVEAASIDSAFAELAPAEWQGVIAGLTIDDALLTETSAELRGVGVGATLIGRQTHRISGVLPDMVLGGAELVMTHEAGDPAGVGTPRYLLILFEGDRSFLEESVRSLLPTDLPVRIRALGETPFLRHGDAVLPQALIKETFGEFTIRPTQSGDTAFDPEWAARNVVTAALPIIGEVRCHVVMVEQLAGALSELERANLGFLIESFDGCYNPRFIAGSRLLSRHAWGAAIDLNYEANPTGQVTVQDPRLVEIMEKWGFTWGGNWLVPDAAHFEWVGLPHP
ncbi:MAG: M15 family metallopeptidase [Actinobacteria bacterium]|nr:M15 family metallopeptidase [Actinomycetota bacterium]